MHVSAPVAIWNYVYVYLKAGGDSKAIWTYVCAHVSAPVVTWTYAYACMSAGGDMDLRFCMSQRRQSYGLMPVHV